LPSNGFHDEARWLRWARTGIAQLFPYLPKQPGYDKRLRAAAEQLKYCIRPLAADTAFWSDDVWIVDRPRWNALPRAVKRSALAGWGAVGSWSWQRSSHGSRPSRYRRSRIAVRTASLARLVARWVVRDHKDQNDRCVR